MELRCPFCGGEVKIIVCDDEGNHPKEPGYEQNPWSGLGFMLYHSEDDNPDCPIAHEAEGQFGRKIYNSREEAAAAWKLAETNQH